MNKHPQDYRSYAQQAHHHLQQATELLGKVFELSKDPKVLVSILHHLAQAQQVCIDFVGFLEGTKLDTKTFCEQAQQQCSEEELQTIQEVHRLCTQQKESDVEFRRKDSYVLCDGDYQLETLTKERLYHYLEQTTKLIQNILR